MWKSYARVTNIEDALNELAEKQGAVRIVAGATDLMLEIERGQRPGLEGLVDITGIAGLGSITMDEDGWVHLGPLVTHNDCAGSKLLRSYAYPLVRAAWEVGSPQIRNRGTVVGNVITASPANDTITPLMALGTVVSLRSVRGERRLPLEEFYQGVRKTVMQPDEMVVDLAFPVMKENERGIFIKYALRRAQAISLVNIAVILSFSGKLPASGGVTGKVIERAVITLGAVSPVIIHAEEAEKFLAGKVLEDDVIHRVAELVREAVRPISDVRSSASYRKQMSGVLARRALIAIRDGREQEGFPEAPILLSGIENGERKSLVKPWRMGDPIETMINGKPYRFENGQDKSLLRLLREDAELIGSKEGCAEGECGACTVFLDGMAVMSCLVPAPRAHGAEIVTIEGLAEEDHLHPVQDSFVQAGAVQCGYCTPGLIMSSVKLLEERPKPTLDDIRQALAGNLCRCTGYYKIIEAVEKVIQD
jgi:carbon-monoxide dehydrogenase medium subunit